MAESQDPVPEIPDRYGESLPITPVSPEVQDKVIQEGVEASQQISKGADWWASREDPFQAPEFGEGEEPETIRRAHIEAASNLRAHKQAQHDAEALEAGGRTDGVGPAPLTPDDRYHQAVTAAQQRKSAAAAQQRSASVAPGGSGGRGSTTHAARTHRAREQVRDAAPQFEADASTYARLPQYQPANSQGRESGSLDRVSFQEAQANYDHAAERLLTTLTEQVQGMSRRIEDLERQIEQGLMKE